MKIVSARQVRVTMDQDGFEGLFRGLLGMKANGGGELARVQVACDLKVSLRRSQPLIRPQELGHGWA